MKIHDVWIGYKEFKNLVHSKCSFSGGRSGCYICLPMELLTIIIRAKCLWTQSSRTIFWIIQILVGPAWVSISKLLQPWEVEASAPCHEGPQGLRALVWCISLTVFLQYWMPKDPGGGSRYSVKEKLILDLTNQREVSGFLLLLQSGAGVTLPKENTKVYICINLNAILKMTHWHKKIYKCVCVQQKTKHTDQRKNRDSELIL